jgi:hypothetical protein
LSIEQQSYIEVNTLDILNTFQIWFQEKRANLEALGYQLEINKSFIDKQIDFIRLDLDSDRKIARISLWNSGECQAEIIDVDSEKTLLDEHLDLNENINFDKAFENFLEQISKSD